MRALALLALATVISTPALAQDSTAYYSAGVGYYDVISPDDSAADFRLEYRSDYDFLADDLHPWVGLEFTSDASVWAGFGFLYDWNIAPDFYLTPSVGAGYYAKGSSDKDLDYALEFRSQLEGAYQFEDKSRLGLAFGHISNASLGDKNPGVEILNLYYHVPTDSFF
ncbi:MAG: acyloxyacyl hydrolase [Alphaproteobacteria bacterium]|nr:acyloxyacyl hydrolase [Alphaproteobacteria bacterium]